MKQPGKKVWAGFLIALGVALAVSAEAQPCEPPQKPKRNFAFKLLKHGLHIDTSLVKTSGVYLSEYDHPEGPRYSFLRFFGNGRVFISGMYCSPLKPAELNDLSYGFRGQYRVDSNTVTVETFYRHGTLGTRYYLSHLYRIRDNGVYLYGTRKRDLIAQPVVPDSIAGLKRNYFYPVILEAASPQW